LIASADITNVVPENQRLFIFSPILYYIFFYGFYKQIMTSGMILILGVTASGKGRLAFELAESLGAEIISIDSMKVYRRMNIGTAKPPKHVLSSVEGEARQRVKYHLIDVVEPSESFSVGKFLDLTYDAIGQISSRNKPIIAVGGTALYIKALLYGLFEGPSADEHLRTELKKRAQTEGLTRLHKELTQVDPIAANRISPKDAKRIIRALEVYKLTGKPISSFQKQWKKEDRRQKTEDSLAVADTATDDRKQRDYDWTIMGLRREKAEENRRINARVKKMIAIGLVDEVKSLLAEEKPLSPQARSAIGYAEIIDYLNSSQNLEDTIELIKKNTRRLAKHQRTWFKSFPPRRINWLDIEPNESAGKILSRAEALIETL
jgi:tRNA dimethylallyltransferase